MVWKHGDLVGAFEAFEEAGVAMRGQGLEYWSIFHQTPHAYLPGLRTQAIWEIGDHPEITASAQLLEQHADTLRANLRLLLQWEEVHDRLHEISPAMVKPGKLYQWNVYEGGNWNDTYCAGPLAASCAAFQGAFPGDRLGGEHAFIAREERLTIHQTMYGEGETQPPESFVRHGTSNTRLALFMALDLGDGGLDLVTLAVYTPDGNKGVMMEDGSVTVCIDDGFDRHFVQQRDDQRRPIYYITMEILHPDILEDPGRFVQRNMEGQDDSAQPRPTPPKQQPQQPKSPPAAKGPRTAAKSPPAEEKRQWGSPPATRFERRVFRFGGRT